MQSNRIVPIMQTLCNDSVHTDSSFRHYLFEQEIRGQNYFIGCLSSAICESAAPGQVAFAVNDGSGDYGDNRGTFTVVITNWT